MRTVIEEPQRGRLVDPEPVPRAERVPQRRALPSPDHRPDGAGWPERADRPEGGAAWA